MKTQINAQVTKAKSFYTFNEKALEKGTRAIDEFQYTSILQQPMTSLTLNERAVILLTVLCASVTVFFAFLSVM